MKAAKLTWGKRLLQLGCLLRVEHAKGVEVLGAADLELHHVPAPLYLHRSGVFPSRREKEILDLMSLLRLQIANAISIRQTCVETRATEKRESEL